MLDSFLILGSGTLVLLPLPHHGVGVTMLPVPLVVACPVTPGPGGPLSHSLQIAKKPFSVPGSTCRAASLLVAHAGAGGGGGGRGPVSPQPVGAGADGAECRAAPPLCPIIHTVGNGIDGGGGGTPGGGCVQAGDDDGLICAPPLGGAAVVGPGGPSIKPSPSFPPPGHAPVLRVGPVGRLGGVAVPLASLLLLELLGDPPNSSQYCTGRSASA